jgi:hypothetical protein
MPSDSQHEYRTPLVPQLYYLHQAKNYAHNNMATAYKILIDPSRVGLLGYKHNEAAAAKLSELLQKDLDVSSG